MADKTKSRGVRMTSELISQVEQHAEADGETFNDIIIAAVEQYLQPENSIAALTNRVETLESELSNRLATMEGALIDFINATGTHFTRLRAQGALNFQSLDYMLMYAADGPMLAKWPQERQRLLVKYGIVKQEEEKKNENRI